MNYTENYHLPQWVKEDRIMMEDFNAAMAGIEEGMSANAQAAERAAELPYVLGTYQGTGHALDVNLGFQPSLVIIFSPSDSYSHDLTIAFFSMFGRNLASTQAYITETGFSISEPNTGLQCPRMSQNYQKYQYIAFK